MTLVLLLAFALGADGLNADVIWADELSSVTHMGAFNPPYTPMQVMESIFKHARDHVPLYYLLGAGWSQLAGWSRASGRVAGAAVVAAFRRRAVKDVEFHYGIGSTNILYRRGGEWSWTMEFLAGRRFSRRFGVRAGLSAVAPGSLGGGIRFFPKAYGVMSF